MGHSTFSGSIRSIAGVDFISSKDATTDLGINRQSSTVLEVNNGTPVADGGAYRDLTVRTLTATSLSVSGTTIVADTSVTTPLLTYAGTLAISATGANPITFLSGGTEGFRLAPTTRNVLIGTTTDDGSSKLQVAGVITTNGSGGGIQINTRNSGANWTQYVNAGTYTLHNGSEDILSLSSGGTLALYNQKTTTGVTQQIIRAGAGQSTTALLTLQENGGGMRGEWKVDNLSIGRNLSTETVNLYVGAGRSGNGFSIIDLIGDSTYTAYGLRIMRSNGGANTDAYVSNRGTGTLQLQAEDAGAVQINANSNTRFKADNTGIGFFGVTPVARAAAPTAADASALTSADATVIGNIRTRMGEVITALQNVGLMN